MSLRVLLVVFLSFSSIFSAKANEEKSENLTILMPNAVANRIDDYLCTSLRLNDNEPIYITGFNPSAKSKDAHHMLLYGCTEPGSEKSIWNCGEMATSMNSMSSDYENGPTCRSGSTIIYAWALDADKTELPKDVAFKIGGSTTIKYLVLQVHYANVDKFKAGEKDRSGFILTQSPRPAPKRAGVLILASNGRIKAKSEEILQVACRIEQDIVLHPFAFRTHAHKLGLTISGYRVRGENEKQEWSEIGRRSPQLPQMFYPVKKNVTIQRGDYVTAACTMFNTRSKLVRIGSTSDDEMCNFYLMYWVDGDQLLNESMCLSRGAPFYYFRKDRRLNVDKMPDDAFRVPLSPSQESEHHHSHPSPSKQ